jgi:8-oxo-dGTP diphosphatase
VPRPAELKVGTDSLIDAIDVIVGIVTSEDGRVLIARRPEGKHMAGAWEFPGGKLLSGESALAGLKRELAEELGIGVDEAEPFTERRYHYPDCSVRLDVWWVLAYRGVARSCEGQALRWVDSVSLAAAPMLPADAPVVAAVCRRLTRTGA